MGKMQGVKASSSPMPRKLAAVSQTESFLMRSTMAHCSDSPSVSTKPVGGPIWHSPASSAAGTGSAAWMDGAATGAPAGSSRTAVFCIGG